MDELNVENASLNVIPVTEYDPFEAKFAASLYWLVFRATEDGEFENIPSQVTSPIQRDSEKRITVRPEVTEFLTNGEIYCKVCDSIFHGKIPVVGQWAIIQTLSRHGFYVVEEGDIAVTDSALQQRKPFRKSTHLALMDCLMSAFSARAVTVQQVVQSVSKYSSFNASKELPFDLEDALLLWINKICAALNNNQLKKQKQHAEQLLQNQDKAKRFRFRRDQLQPKVQTAFPVMEDLLKDISDGQSLLGIIMFYHPTVISLEDIRFDKNLSTEDCVHNLDLFHSLCSQFICTSVLALKLEDILYGSQAMKPNVIALLAEVFHKCEVESLSTENGVKEKPTSKSDVDLRYIVANKENVVDNRSSSAPVLNSDKNKGLEHGSPRESFKDKNEKLSSLSGQLRSTSSDPIEQVKSSVWKSHSDTQVNANSRLSFKSPFQLDFTVDDDMQQLPLNGPLLKQDVHEKDKEKENPFSGIFQRPVLAGDRKRSLPANMPGTGGSPRTTPRQEHSLLARRNKQKQRTLDLEEWDMQQEEVEELHLNDLQRSQSLTGLDKAKVEPRQSFHAWREDTGASLSDTNLTSSKSERISLDFRPNLATSITQRATEGSIPHGVTEGNIPYVPMTSSGSKAKREEHTSQDSLSSTDSLNMRPPGEKPMDSVLSGARDSCMSDISAKELNQFEEIEAMILAGKSVETPRTFVKPRNKLSKAPASQDDEDDLNTSVSSEDMNMFRLEVLQRLTEDKLRQIPDGAEMEDDDDPILLARSNAASGSRDPPDQRTRLEVPDAPADVPSDQLSPITETVEPVVSNPNSVSSANSTAPSSPCSPLDVAPFMPTFFTTSPANTLDRKRQRLSMKGREDTEGTLVGEDEDDYPSDPQTSATPRFQTRLGDKSRDFTLQNKSFEQLARGSYTVGHVSVESAKAAGIPVIAGAGPVTEAAGGPVVENADPRTEAGIPVFNHEIRERTGLTSNASGRQETSDVFDSRKLSQRETDSSQDLSGFRPLVLSAGGVESIGVPPEGVDRRRDSLESSPAHSPALTHGKRDDVLHEAALRSREMAAQDSPSDVVIFERSLSSSSAPEENAAYGISSQTRENSQFNSGTVTRSNKAEAYVFDFNQDTVHHYKNENTAQDFTTYKKGKQNGRTVNEVLQGDLRAASSNEFTADERFQGSQQDTHSSTYSKSSHAVNREQGKVSEQLTSDVKEFDSHDRRYRHRISEDTPVAGVYAKDLRQSDGFSTFRKDSTSEMNGGEVEREPSAHVSDLRRSDGFTTFRKGETAASSEGLPRKFPTAVTTGERQDEQTDKFSTFAKSAKKQDGSQQQIQEGLHHFHDADGSERTDLQQTPLVYDVTARPLPSRGWEDERQTSPRGGMQEQIRASGSSNIARSRTFRKKPDGQIIEDYNIVTRDSQGNDEVALSASGGDGGGRLPTQQTVVTNIRGSPEGAGNDNPHRISWTDESEAGARLMRQHGAIVDRSTAQESPTGSPRRRGSPRQTGRGSPGARISWLTAAKSGVGGQVMLNDKGCMQEETRKQLFADGPSSHDRPHLIATAVIRPNSLRQTEASPWRYEAPEHSGLRAASQVGPSLSHHDEQAPVISTGLVNGNIPTGTCSVVDNDPRPPTAPMEASSSTSEPDTRTGGSIRDRIAALSAAAGVSRLNVTPGREQSRTDVTPSMDQSTVAAEKGVAFDVEFQKAPKPRPPPRVISRFRTKELAKKNETVVCDFQVANNRQHGPVIVNNREFGSVNNREVGPENNRELGTVNEGELRAVNSRELGAVSNKELGAVKDKSVAFEVSFGDEPQSKRPKDEPALIQSPFKTFKMRANRRNQQKSNVKPLQPQRKESERSLNCAQNGYFDESVSMSSFSSGVGLAEKAMSDELSSVDVTLSELASQPEDCNDHNSSEVPMLQKRNAFTLDSVPQFTKNASDREVLMAAKVTLTGQDRSSNSEEPKLQKRNTFTLDSDLGQHIAKALNDLAGKEDCQTTTPQGQQRDQLQKRNTFTLDFVSKEGVPIVTVLNDLASEEENKQNKQHPVLSNETSQKRGTFTLDPVSQSIQNASGEGVHITTVLNDLANEEELKQSKQRSSVDTSALPNDTSQKRSTFTLESVSREIDDAIEKYFPNEIAVVDALAKKDSTSSKKQESSEKRSTYTLDSVSLSLQSGTEEGLPPLEVLSQLAKEEELHRSSTSGPEGSVQKRGTFTLDSVSLTLEETQDNGLFTTEVLSQLAKQEELHTSSTLGPEGSVEKRGTFTLDSVSQTLEEAEDKGLSATEVLSQLAKQEELLTSSTLGPEGSVQKRGTFTLDSVSQTLEEAQDKGVPAVDALHQLASKEECHPPDASPVVLSHSNPPQNRGTYTLDTVSHAIEEAVEKGIPISVTLNHLAQEGKVQQHSHTHDGNDATASNTARGLREPDARALSPEYRGEYEASFEDALEQLEDCETFDSGEAFSKSSKRERPFSGTPQNRGTYDLDDVSTSLQDDAKDGVPVVETLERLSRTSGVSKDDVTKAQSSGEKRGTYTLDEVSRSLQTASEQGIPVVEALQNLTRTKETSCENGENEEGVGKRGTYTLNEVSKSLEHAKQTGIPVIEALETLSKDKRKSLQRLKIPDRGTYTLDEVSHTLEKAKQKGLPVVEALGHLTGAKDSPVRQAPDAVHRRQEKLINRKTYAMASPLETIGEGAKLRLYDGSQRQMMSPISFHVKSKDFTASKANSTDSKTRGLGVVQKLDFLTSACELLLEASAKEMAKDQTRTESTQDNPTSDESVRGSHEALPRHVNESQDNPDGSQPERNTYSLDSVALTIDEAKAKGVAIVETLKKVTSDTKPNGTQRANLMRLNSKSDSELINDESGKESSDRYTHSLENVSRTLEDAKKAGIPVIEALDELTNDLAEFSLTAMSGNFPIGQSGKDNRKRKRYSETAIRGYKEQSPQASPHASPYPPPIRKAYSLDDVAFAVQQAFQSGTSLTDFLDDIAFEKPAEPVSSSKDVRPRSVDSGFVSSFSDNDISSQSFESPRNRSNTYNVFDSSTEELDLAKTVAANQKETLLNTETISRSSNVNQDENRRTFTLDHVGELTRGVPVIEALEKPSNNATLKTENPGQLEYNKNAKNIPTNSTLRSQSNSLRKKSPPKPKRQFFKKTKSPQANSDSFVIEFFDSNCPQQSTPSKYQIVNNKVEQITEAKHPVKDVKDSITTKDISTSSICSTPNVSESTGYNGQVSLDKRAFDIDLEPKEPDSMGLKSKEPEPVSSSTPARLRATWRPSGSVLDKIASLMDAGEDCGMTATDVLNQVTDLRYAAEGEIEESQQDEAEEDQAVTSQMAYLRIQLDEKRRHIEAEKHRAQAEWEDQRWRLGQTAFWYVIGKAQGGQTVGEGPGSEALHSAMGPAVKPHSHDKPRKPVAEFPDQPSPPIAWSSPANSPLPPSASHPNSNGPQFETREFRLSDYPPGSELGTNRDITRPSSQPAVEVSSRPTPVPPRPSSHDPVASHHTAPTRKCWDVDAGKTATPPPLVRPDTASVNTDTKHETVSPAGGGTAEIEVENHTLFKKGLAMFIGDDASPGSQGLTPEQEKKREKFMRLRQKKQEEDRTRKEAELEKKRRREEKQREKEMLQKMEEERLRQEELERQRAEQELRIRQAQAARVPDSYATYRRPGPRQQFYDVNDDAGSYFAPGPPQPSGFAEFSGPQCYVKPSGKSNRKIIVNAISYVCLSGTVNQDQKEKCLQAISESDGHHFMILFKDGLKFRGIYVHNLDNDQLFKVFGIGPRVVTGKMIEFLYKYNSGGKEFTKIPSKTISISVDGFAIQKSCWNTGKPVVPSKTSSNLKRPPRPPQR